MCDKKLCDISLLIISFDLEKYSKPIFLSINRFFLTNCSVSSYIFGNIC